MLMNIYLTGKKLFFETKYILTKVQSTGWRTKYSHAGSRGAGTGAEKQPPRLLFHVGGQCSRLLAPVWRQLPAP